MPTQRAVETVAAGGQGLFVGRRDVLARLAEVLEQTRTGTPRWCR